MTRSLRLYLRLLTWRPGRALAIAYWYLTRRRVRARNWLQDAAASSPFAYDALIRTMEREIDTITNTAEIIAEWTHIPFLSVLMIIPDNADPRLVISALRSIERQCYPEWEVVIVCLGTPIHCNHVHMHIISQRAENDAEALVLGLAAARGSFVVPWTIGAELAPTALFRFAEALQAMPNTGIFYGDQDSMGALGERSRPWLKPDWNPEMILALDFVSRACMVRTTLAQAAIPAIAPHPGCPVYAMIIAVTVDEDVVVVHIPHIIVHVRLGYAQDDQVARVGVTSARLAHMGASAVPGPFGTVVVRWPLPEHKPSVSILVPTRDSVDLLRACVGSVLERTDYDNYDLLVIDNGSVEPETVAYFDHLARDPRVSILPCEMPYNYSAINNFAVECAGGDFLCFLNNDTEVISGDWLAELMRYAVRPAVGAVGAKLLYADHSIQHAGVVMGLGNAAGHAHRGLAADCPGYFAQAHAAHYASAVTAACMVVEKRKFQVVGGFDEDDLQIAYNDVDLCLKLKSKGWHNVYAPQATLFHLESKSRGADLSPDHIARYMRELGVLQARWKTMTVVDPMHHPGLDRASETYRFRFDDC